MAGPTGHGDSLGAALNDLLRSQVTPPPPAVVIYRQALARPAQPAHRDLPRAAGPAARRLHVTTKTLISRLSDAEYNVRRSYRDLIHTAYENTAIVPADPIPDHIKRGQYEISGVVKTGDDERTRGTVDAAPLRIDGGRGHWDEIEGLWLTGELTDDEFEDHFIDDGIVEDIGEGTDGWEFPGASYAVELR
ncbi:hypothetical protein [Streptomyces sp. Ag109_O5-10]|uniref:hypothetical protein n=1 Tax=Streptomyces sp. Ag109_O5-10 TaxID=1855349 RepID=UPI00089CD73A|nr:hypothetical protein [Streptomyces sp. Ag109_O5-10]SED61940.1 hypothetical protein SAMN05216533_0106 [Streptomyces sp. Ag109_O5-10]